MSKRREIVTVEGCPCEALEWAEMGVVREDAATYSAVHRLVIAPDGTLFIACYGDVSICSPSWPATQSHLRRLARALA